MCMRTVYNVCGSRHVCAHRQRWRNISVCFSGCYACARRQRWSTCHTLAAITVSVHTYMGSGVEIISPQVLWRLSCPCTQRWRTCLILAAVTVSVHTYVGTGGEIISPQALCRLPCLCTLADRVSDPPSPPPPSHHLLLQAGERWVGVGTDRFGVGKDAPERNVSSLNPGQKVG